MNLDTRLARDIFFFYLCAFRQLSNIHTGSGNGYYAVLTAEAQAT